MTDEIAQLTEAAADKPTLRSWMLHRRAAMSPTDLAVAARKLTAVVLAVPEVAAARCVAAYASVGHEPGTRHLLDELIAREVLVLLPVLLVDHDLDWAEYTGVGDLEPARHGLVEPVGARLGTQAIEHASAILVPALAVDSGGMRLGQGAGCYDRALARVDAGALRCAMLHDGEVLPAGVRVPHEAHDERVDAVATPAGLQRFG